MACRSVALFQAKPDALLRLLARLRTSTKGIDVVPAAGRRALCNHAIAVLNELLAPALTDPYLQQRCRGLAPLIAHLRDLAAYGTDRLRHEQLTELGALCESPPDDDLAAARRRLVNSIGAATGAANAAILRWLLHDSWRRHRLMRDALGVMHARELRLD